MPLSANQRLPQCKFGFFTSHVFFKMLSRRLLRSAFALPSRILRQPCSTTSATTPKTVDDLEFEDFEELIDEVQSQSQDSVSFLNSFYIDLPSIFRMLLLQSFCVILNLSNLETLMED